MDSVKLLLHYAARGGWIAFAALVIFLFLYYEKVGLIVGHAYRLLAWTGKSFQKKYVAQDISARVNPVAKKLNRELAGLMPYSLEVKWVKPSDTDREAFIRQGKVVLRMDYYLNQDRNLCNVIHEFVSKAHLQRTKAYLLPELSQSVDLRLTVRYLTECQSDDALTYFVQNVLSKNLGDSRVEVAYRKLEALDDYGFFTRVLLAEFVQFAGDLFPNKVGLPEILEETTRFVGFLTEFPSKAPGSDIELDFRGKYIKVRFVLVARLPKYVAQGNAPYVNRIAEGLSSFADTVYVCARDKLIGAAARVAKQAAQEYNLKVGAVHHFGAKYQDKVRGTVCISLRRN